MSGNDPDKRPRMDADDESAETDDRVTTDTATDDRQSFDWTESDELPLQPTDQSDDSTDNRGAPRHTSTIEFGREPPVLIQPPRTTGAEGAGASHPDISNATIMALLAHMSVMFGLPFFLIPLWMRSDELSLHHARTAGAIYIIFYGLLGLSTISCGVFFPLAMLGYIPALVAIYRAVQGRSAGKWGLGHVGEWLFGWIQSDE